MYLKLILSKYLLNLDPFLAQKFHMMKLVNLEDMDMSNSKKKNQPKNVYKISHL